MVIMSRQPHSPILFCILLTFYLVHGQRAPYAGRRPGTGSAAVTTATQDPNDLSNRFGNNPSAAVAGGSGITPTTQRLPYDAYGDTELINQLNQLDESQRPYWFLNYQQIEKHRGTPTQQQQQQQQQQTNGQTDIGNRFAAATDTMITSDINKISQYEIVYPVSPDTPINGNRPNTQPIRNNVPVATNAAGQTGGTTGTGSTNQLSSQSRPSIPINLQQQQQQQQQQQPLRQQTRSSSPANRSPESDDSDEYF